MATGSDFRSVYQFGTFVIWPPAELRAEVNRLRQRYDPASQAACDAHITLTQPLLAEPSEDDWSEIERVAGNHSPLTIQYGPLDSFLPYPCVYVRIEPPEALLALRSDLHALGLFNLSLPHSDPTEFIPHMSITDGYPDADQTRQILDALRGSDPRGAFQATQIAYIRPDEQSHFSEVRASELGGR